MSPAEPFAELPGTNSIPLATTGSPDIREVVNDQIDETR
jgi:hypothetical protein